jgi:hypothetical protein
MAADNPQIKDEGWTMRRAILLAAAVLATLCGCQNARLANPAERKVPITKPKETSPLPATAPSPPAAIPSTTPATPPENLSSAEVVTGSLIQVNDRFFAVEDILRAAAWELSNIPKGLPDPSFRSRAEKIIQEEIRRQVSQSLVLTEADKTLDEEQKKFIDQELNDTLAQMVSQAGGSKKKLEADLVSRGTTLQAVLDNHRRELTVRLYLRLKFAPTVSVNRAMLWDYYRRHRDQYVAPKKVQMQIIAVPLSAFLAGGSARPSASELAAARAAARARIDEAAAALKAGEDFAAVADRFPSNNRPGGLWPPMPAGSFRQDQVEQAAFSQSAGQVSGIIETDEGFYIVKTVAVQPESTTRFEDAQVAIEKTLRDQQAARIYNDYYAKLLKTATIVTSENFVPTAVEQAVRRYGGK